MWRIGLLLCLVAGSRQLSFTQFSVPHSVESGDDVSLQCKYALFANESEKALFVKWWWTPFDSEEKIQLYQRIAGHEADAIQSHIEIAENDNIVLQNITPAYSGTYECEVSAIVDEIRQHQKLIVFTSGSGLKLNLTAVEDGPDEDADADVLVTCEAADVAPLPDLIVSVDGQEVPAEELVSKLGEGLYNISATVRLSDDVAEDARVACELTYTDASVSHPQYIAAEIYNAGQSEMSTTEEPEDPSTADPTSITLQNTRDSSGQLAAYFFLVLSVIMFQIML